MSDVLCGSHIPVLVKLMEHVNKPVLELGVGYSSTPLLHWLCKDKRITLYSAETDNVWADRFKEYSDQFSHYLFYVNNDWNWAFIDDFIPRKLGLVFVDNRPAKKRVSNAVYFKDRADFIVLHDSELADHPAYKYDRAYKHFKYVYHYTKVKPYTAILSNFIDVERMYENTR